MPAAPPNSNTNTRSRKLLEPLLVALEGGEIGRALVAEGDRHRLLQVAAAGHRRVAIFLRQRRERVRNGVDVLLDERERLADLHDGGGVGDVLGGGAPVAPFAQAALAELDELRHHRQHRIADALGLLLQLLDVEVIDLAVLDDLVAGLLRDDLRAWPARAPARPRSRDISGCGCRRTTPAAWPRCRKCRGRWRSRGRSRAWRGLSRIERSVLASPQPIRHPADCRQGDRRVTGAGFHTLKRGSR